MPAPPISAPPWLGLIFYEMGGQGWSEKYLLMGTKNEALTKLNEIRILRQNCLVTAARAVYSRLSDMSKKGDAYVQSYLQADGTGELDTIPAPPCVALDLRQETEEGAHATRFIHGVPANCWTADWVVNGASSFSAPFGLYKAKLLNDTVLHIKNPQTGAYEVKAIQAVVDRTFGCRKVGLPFGLSRGRRARATP